MSNLSVIEDNDISSDMDDHILSIEQKIHDNIHDNVHDNIYDNIHDNVQTCTVDTDVKDIHEYSIVEKKELVNKINMLSKIEHIEIFKIFKKNNIKYTENSNGIFINFMNIADSVITLLDKFIKFCYKNKDSLVEKENILNENKNIIENKYYSSSSSNSDEEIISDHDEEHNNVDGSKIVLKKDKPTYTGIKAKIMKNYKVGVKTNK